MMESKYYTPEIEEFHFGFEYEREEPYLGRWDKCWHDGSPSPKHLEKYSEEFRVKHLDREDIEAEGFEFSFRNDPDTAMLEFNMRFVKKKDKGEYDIAWHEKHNIMRISWTCLSGSHETRRIFSRVHFIGKLKNKSELKRILKQIGV